MLTDIAIIVVAVMVLFVNIQLFLIHRTITILFAFLQDEESFETRGEMVSGSVPDLAIVDSSPAHLKQKRDERLRKGEDPEPDDSAIVRTKSAQQRQMEVNASKEAKLDKWMPGVKRGK